MYVCMYVPGYNFGYYVDEFWVFWVFWRIFFGYTGIPLPPPPPPHPWPTLILMSSMMLIRITDC